MYQTLKQFLNKHKLKITLTAYTLLAYFNTSSVFAVGQLQGQLNSIFNSLANLVLSLIVAGGVLATGWQAFQKMFVTDDPQEKSEGKRAIVRIWIFVAIAAAARWLVPAIFELFS